MLALAPNPTIPDAVWIRVLLLQKLLEEAADTPGTREAPPADWSVPQALRYSLGRRMAAVNEARDGSAAEPLRAEELGRIEAAFVWYERVHTESEAEFALEMWEGKSLLEKLPLDALRFIPVDKRSGLECENHDGMGYHLHYLEGKVPMRTSLLLLFDREEPEIPEPLLYWEHHGKGRAAKPATFGEKRRKKVYLAALRSLTGRAKSAFRRLGMHSKLFFPSGEGSE